VPTLLEALRAASNGPGRRRAGVGDQAVIDDDSLGAGSTCHRPGFGVGYDERDLVVTESGDHLRAGADLDERADEAPVGFGASRRLCTGSLPRQAEILSAKANACRPNDPILTGRCHEHSPLRAWLVFDAAQLGTVDEGLG